MSRSMPASRRSSTFCTRLSARRARASPISIPSPPPLWPPTSLRKILSRSGPTPAIAITSSRTQLTDARDKDHGGIVTNFDELKSVEGVTPAVLGSLANNYSLSTFAIRNAEIVGPKVGAQLRHQAFWATLYALGGMLVYIAFRFEWVYGAAAVIAVFHDVLITLGFFSLFHYEISLTVIAALLTLVGYSMNDTIVIFDRVRENLRLMRREPFTDIVNKSINQTLSRTILTSGLTFLTVLVLFLMGGEVLRAFSFAMVVGVVVGTYSSFGIAAPIVVVWNKYHDGQGSTVRAGSAAGKRAAAASKEVGSCSINLSFLARIRKALTSLGPWPCRRSFRP